MVRAEHKSLWRWIYKVQTFFFIQNLLKSLIPEWLDCVGGFVVPGKGKDKHEACGKTLSLWRSRAKRIIWNFWFQTFFLLLVSWDEPTENYERQKDPFHKLTCKNSSRRGPVWKVRFCYAKGLRHASCPETIDLLLFYCS